MTTRNLLFSLKWRYNGCKKSRHSSSGCKSLQTVGGVCFPFLLMMNIHLMKLGKI